MSFDNKWTPIDNDNDEEGDVSHHHDLKDAILFAIHISDTMLTLHSNDGGANQSEMNISSTKSKKPSSAVRSALECAYSILQSRIISSPNDMMGILLFGTQMTKFNNHGDSHGGFAHCYLVMDLDVPDADSIKSLKVLLEDEFEWNNIMIPATNKVSMANVLFGVNQIFTTRAPNFWTRKVFIVTDDDDPHSDDRALKQSSITRARDLYDLGIQIDPIYISCSGTKTFDPSNFYEDIIYCSPYEDEDVRIASSGITRLEEMVTTIRSKATPKRTQFCTKLELGPGLHIGVKGYLKFKKQEKGRSHYIYTSGEKVQLVDGATINMAEFTATVVERAEIKKAYRFGGEQVVFTQAETKAMRNFGDPCIRLVGFKHRSSIRFDLNVKPAHFIYPDDKDYIGSVRTFTALHQKLVTSGKIGVCWCVTRRNSPPTVSILYPSAEIIENGKQVHPPGFFMIVLPFADDVRNNPEISKARAPEALVDSMRKVVKQLHMPRYSPGKYENPSLQWHYRILQAIALDEDLPEQPVDRTVPKYKLIQKHAGQMVLDWAYQLEKYAGTLLTAATKSAGGKRVKEDFCEAFPIKKVKMPTSVDDINAVYRRGQLTKVTMVALKEYCKKEGLDASGKKIVLVERIEEYLDSK